MCLFGSLVQQKGNDNNRGLDMIRVRPVLPNIVWGGTVSGKTLAELCSDVSEFRVELRVGYNPQRG